MENEKAEKIVDQIVENNDLKNITDRIGDLFISEEIKLPGERKQEAVAVYLAVCFGVEYVKNNNQYLNKTIIYNIAYNILIKHYSFGISRFPSNQFNKVVNILQEKGLIIPIYKESIASEIGIPGTTSRSFIATHPLTLEAIAGEVENSPLHSLNYNPSPPGSDAKYNYWFRFKGDTSFGSFVHIGSTVNMLFSAIYSACFFDENVEKIEVIGEIGTSRIFPTVQKLIDPVEAKKIEMNIKCREEVSGNEKIKVERSRKIAELVKMWYVNINRLNELKNIEFGAVAVPFKESAHTSSELTSSDLYSVTFYLQNDFINVLKSSLQEPSHP